jgi:anti-sigma factor RsiW
MNTQTGCPDASLLSQFLDHELEGEESTAISYHLETCPTCSARVKHLGRTAETLQAALPRPLPQTASEAPSSECLPPELVAGYVQRALSPEEMGKVEGHLQACTGCLAEVMEAFRVSAVLTAAKKEAVPVSLRARVASFWQRPAAPPQAPAFSRLVIQIAQKGLQLLEQHLVEPLRDVQTMLSPMPAYRAGEESAALDLRLEAGQATVALSAVPEGKGMALKITLLNAAQEGLTGQRIFLRQQGAPIFSARTDQDGVIRVAHLELGTYEVVCSGIQTTFQLDLRA